MLAYPDGCTRGETVFDPRTGDVIVQVPPLSEEKLYPKEKALVDLVAAERLEGRQGAGLRDPHGDQGHHRADGRHAHTARVPRGGDEGLRRGPRTAGRRGWRTG